LPRSRRADLIAALHRTAGGFAKRLPGARAFARIMLLVSLFSSASRGALLAHREELRAARRRAGDGTLTFEDPSSATTSRSQFHSGFSRSTRR